MGSIDPILYQNRNQHEGVVDLLPGERRKKKETVRFQALAVIKVPAKVTAR